MRAFFLKEIISGLCMVLLMGCAARSTGCVEDFGVKTYRVTATTLHALGLSWTSTPSQVHAALVEQGIDITPVFYVALVPREKVLAIKGQVKQWEEFDKVLSKIDRGRAKSG